jgi:MFS family permease
MSRAEVRLTASYCIWRIYYSHDFCELITMQLPDLLWYRTAQATLERHLSLFHLDPLHVGMVFMLYGCAYALLNPFWGWLADRVAPRLVILTGSLLLSTGLSLVSLEEIKSVYFSV